MVYLTFDAIDPHSFLAAGQGHQRGASVLFLGIVRDHSQYDDAPPKQVLFLEYEAYETMAEALLAHLISRAHAQWPLAHVRLQHRLGRVALGEVAVAIEVSSAHRDEAYRASRYLIDEIKHRVPIWKKEFFSDGSSHWSLCSHANPDRHSVTGSQSGTGSQHAHSHSAPVASLRTPQTPSL